MVIANGYFRELVEFDRLPHLFQTLDDLLQLPEFGRSGRAEFEECHLDRRDGHSDAAKSIDRHVTIVRESAADCIGQKVDLVAVLEQVMSRLADTDVRFDTAKGDLFDVQLAQSEVEIGHSVSRIGQLFDRFRSGIKTTRDLFSRRSEPLRILLGYDYWNIEQLTRFDQ